MMIVKFAGPPIVAIGNIGPEAKEAVPALIEMLKDENKEVRRLAASALDQIDPETYPRAWHSEPGAE